MAPPGTSVDGDGDIVDRLSLGRGLSLIPNLDADAHSDSKTFVQTSTVAIVGRPQPNLLIIDLPILDYPPSSY
jgi:hypothetical protein